VKHKAKDNTRTVVRFTKATDLRDLNLGLARPLHGDQSRFKDLGGPRHKP